MRIASLALLVAVGCQQSTPPAGTPNDAGAPSNGDGSVVGSAWGYVARGCGFDFNQDGVADCDHLCRGEGSSVDIDGNGVADRTLYVDAQNGNDTGNGCAGTTACPGTPFKTVQAAEAALSDPQPRQIQAICLRGVSSETVNLMHGGDSAMPSSSECAFGGGAGYCTRPRSGNQKRDFRYPRYPHILTRWDVNGNGDLTDDDGALDGDGTRCQALVNIGAYTEIAHLGAQHYGLDSCGNSGFSQTQGGVTGYVYFHDLDLNHINESLLSDSNKIIFYHLFANRTPVWQAWENSRVQNMSNYGWRGSSPMANGDAGPLRMEHMSFLGKGGPAGMVFWKIWSHVTGIEILENDVDCGRNTNWMPQNTGATDGMSPAQGVQDVLIRGNRVQNCIEGIGIQGYSPTPAYDRPIDNVVIDRNEIVFNTSGNCGTPIIVTDPGICHAVCDAAAGAKVAYPCYGDCMTYPCKPSSCLDGNGNQGTCNLRSDPLSCVVNNITITNNMIRCENGACNAGITIEAGAQDATCDDVPGQIVIAGNTIYGEMVHCPGSGDPNNGWGAVSLFTGAGGKTPNCYQQDFVVRDNLVAGSGMSDPMFRSAYAAKNLQIENNVYPKDASLWQWAGSDYTTLAAWQTALGGCAQLGHDCASKMCEPAFVNAPSDLHLSSTDTCAIDAGGDISAYTTTDFDGDPRPQGAASDVGADEAK